MSDFFDLMILIDNIRFYEIYTDHVVDQKAVFYLCNITKSIVAVLNGNKENHVINCYNPGHNLVAAIFITSVQRVARMTSCVQLKV